MQTKTKPKKSKIDSVLCFKALCDPVRLSIMELLGGGQLCACDLLEKLSVSQSTLSHHMKTLTDSGLVVAAREATWVYYNINHDTLSALQESLAMLMKKSGQARRGGNCSDSGIKH